LLRHPFHLIVFAIPTGQMPRISYDHRIGNNRTRRGESMNKATRMLAMTGMAIVAGVTFSAGPAAAASASPSPAAPKASTQQADKGFPSDSAYRGWFRSLRACHRAGNIGEWRNSWDDHDCIPVRNGFHRNTWVLKVYWDRHGFPGHGHGFPGHGHGFPGHDDGFPGHGDGFPGHGDGFPGHGDGFPGHDGDGPGHGGFGH
jgi:hypothetical protein